MLWETAIFIGYLGVAGLILVLSGFGASCSGAGNGADYSMCAKDLLLDIRVRFNVRAIILRWRDFPCLYAINRE